MMVAYSRRASKIIVASSLCVAVLLGYHLVEGTGSKGVPAGIVVVPGQPLERTAQDAIASVAPSAFSRSSKLLASGVERSIIKAIPALTNASTACDATSCTLTADIGMTDSDDNQANMEYLLQDDIPSTVERLGYKLIEPTQIEEVGEGQNRIIMHIGK